MRLTRRTVLLAAPALALGAAAMTARPARAATFAPGGVALGGTDPVAYFAAGRATQGSAEHAVAHDGATWRFASAANRDAFAADPAAYAPAYGGWCAWAMAQGYLAETDPDAWTIHEGRLFLNANARIKRRFERDIPGFVAQADANWPSVRPA
jgi:hypothetical protein